MLLFRLHFDVKVLNIEHLCVGGGIHLESGNLRASSSDLEPHEERKYRQILGKDLLSLQVIVGVRIRARQRLERGVAVPVILRIGIARIILTGPAVLLGGPLLGQVQVARGLDTRAVDMLIARGKIRERVDLRPEGGVPDTPRYSYSLITS